MGLNCGSGLRVGGGLALWIDCWKRGLVLGWYCGLRNSREIGSALRRARVVAAHGLDRSVMFATFVIVRVVISVSPHRRWLIL